ncbi:MAG: hypothetical protein EA376_11595 [Phycisphaeraceae bacterium]|nr:MAG: hypothetical protein EA376_11595 [Phycisphaeraceae bacterium]
MSQFGMQMPGSHARQRPGPNVYTALFFIAVVCLLGAVVIVWQAGTKVSPESGALAPFSLQDSNAIRLDGR